MTTTGSTPENESAGEADRSNTDSRAVAGGRLPTRVPEGAEPEICPYCGFELPADDQYRLHLGLNHYDQLDDADQEAFRETYQQEEKSLTRFRIIALGGLVGLYFGFLLIYAVLAT